MKFFEELLQQYGNCAKALDWSERGQRQRFEVACQIQGFHLAEDVLDLGCGLGHLQDFIRNNLVLYTGIDRSETLITEAKKSHPEARFLVGDVLRDGTTERADIVISSGMINIGCTEDDAVRLLAAAWSACRIGAAVNMLSDLAPRKRTDRSYYNPLRMLGSALDIAGRATLRHDYRDNDFTLYLYR